MSEDKYHNVIHVGFGQKPEQVRSKRVRITPKAEIKPIQKTMNENRPRVRISDDELKEAVLRKKRLDMVRARVRAQPFEHKPPMGLGWGGPPKGAKNDPRPEKPKLLIETMSEREIVSTLKNNLLELSLQSDYDANRIRASEALLARIEGAPINRNINVNADDISALDDDALIARREEIERGIRESAARAAKKAG